MDFQVLSWIHEQERMDGQVSGLPSAEFERKCLTLQSPGGLRLEIRSDRQMYRRLVAINPEGEDPVIEGPMDQFTLTGVAFLPRVPPSLTAAEVRCLLTYEAAPSDAQQRKVRAFEAFEEAEAQSPEGDQQSLSWAPARLQQLLQMGATVAQGSGVRIPLTAEQTQEIGHLEHWRDERQQARDAGLQAYQTLALQAVPPLPTPDPSRRRRR